VFYLLGQIAVCLLLTAVMGMALGWLVRGISARAEVTALEQRMQVQLRDLRNRAAAERPASAKAQDEAARVQQQLRLQLVKLQALVDQRDKEIAYLRRMVGDQRSGARGTDSEGRPPRGRPTGDS
jgi:hypothetical protein